MNNKSHTYDEWLYNQKRTLVLINVLRETLAELRHTKEPNKRFATLAQAKLDALPTPDGALRDDHYVSYRKEYGLAIVDVTENRYYDSRCDQSRIHLCWNLTEHETLATGGYVATNGNTWANLEQEINREDPSDTLERIEQEKTLKAKFILLDGQIANLQEQIDLLRQTANEDLAALPIPKAATLRTAPFFWTNPTQWARNQFPHIWPEK